MDGRPVENAVRATVNAGESLPTPTGPGRFTIAEFRSDAIVLLPGAKEARTPLPWAALNTVPHLMRGRDWMPIGASSTLTATQAPSTIT